MSLVKQSISDIAKWGYNINELEESEDWASAWNECKTKGQSWGGRAHGGRGVRVNNGKVRDISVEGVTMEFSGKVLLERTSLKLLRGHRYGLIGHNGVGK